MFRIGRAIVLLIAVLLGATAIGASERPNVIVIVSDDHGVGDVGWNNPEVNTPHLDQLAREGVRLDRFYANPICSVTRAAMMTGLATLRTGVDNSSGLDLKYRILPQIFQEAGYQTWMCGKWHLGGAPDSQRNGPEYLPHARGFDYFYGHLHGAIDYNTHERRDRGELDWQRNGKAVVEAGFSTDLLADDAVRQIRQRDKQRPFFLYLAFNAVHGPLQPPPSAVDVSRRDRRAILLANVSHLDAAIGRVLRTVDEEQIRETTLVVFFGDNGGQLRQGASNGELRGEKGGVFEGGLRVPATLRWTGVLPQGTVSRQFVSVMDLLPTLCAATELPTGIDTPLDGVDLWQALVTDEPREHQPFVMGNKDVACIAEPWKLVIPGRGEAPLLFHLIDDPRETKDLANEHPEVVTKLSEIIHRTSPARRDGQPRGGRTRGDQSQTAPRTPRNR